MSSGSRASLPSVAEDGRTHCGVVPGDETSQAAGFTHAATHKPAVGLDSHRARVVGPVTGLSQQRLDREADPAPGKQRHPTANAQDLPTGAPFVSEGVHRREPSAHHPTADAVRNRPALGPVTHPY
jgi:hypothetical protein